MRPNASGGTDGGYTPAVFVHGEAPPERAAICGSPFRCPTLVAAGGAYFGGMEYVFKRDRGRDAVPRAAGGACGAARLRVDVPVVRRSPGMTPAGLRTSPVPMPGHAPIFPIMNQMGRSSPPRKRRGRERTRPRANRSRRGATGLRRLWLRRPRSHVIAVAALAAGVLLAGVYLISANRWPRRMMVTAYCPCTECCGPNAQGITASGRPVSANGTKFVAADPELPFGTMLVIPGYNNGRPVEVLDRGGAIRGDRLDVYFPTHAEARRWGRQWLMVQRLKGKGGGTRRAAHAR